jgi:hypothetical protein
VGVVLRRLRLPASRAQQGQARASHACASVPSVRRTFGIRITFDLERGNYPIGTALRVPARHDILATLHKDNSLGTFYLITSAREVRRQDQTAPPRFALRCDRLFRNLLGWQQPARPDWVMRWHPRRRRV